MPPQASGLTSPRGGGVSRRDHVPGGAPLPSCLTGPHHTPPLEGLCLPASTGLVGFLWRHLLKLKNKNHVCMCMYTCIYIIFLRQDLHSVAKADLELHIYNSCCPKLGANSYFNLLVTRTLGTRLLTTTGLESFLFFLPGRVR